MTELRGLSAWLAAHCRKPREADLIQERSQLASACTETFESSRPDEKRKLILSLNREVTRLGYFTQIRGLPLLL